MLTKLKKRLTLLLALVMIVTQLPLTAWATEETGDLEAGIETATVSEYTYTPATGVGLKVVGTVSNEATPVEGFFSAEENPAGTVKVTAVGKKAGYTTTATLTITNNTGKTGTVSFGWAAENVNSLVFDGGSTTNTSGNYTSKVLANGESITVVMTTGFTAVKNVLTVSNFTFTEDTSSSAISVSYNSKVGSVTVGGNAVASGTPFEETTTLTAVPGTDTTFLGWVRASDGSFLSSELTYTADTAVKAAFARKDAEAWFKVGNNLFDDLNAADTYAKEFGSTIIPAADGILPAGDYTLSKGVTLHIPYDVDGTMPAKRYEPKVSSKTDLKDIKESIAFRTLTLKDGTDLDIQGELMVGGTVFTSGARDTNTPHGPYGLIVLEGGSNLNITGTAYVYGFIMGTHDKATNAYNGGTVTAASGSTVYELFQVRDLRGSTVTMNAMSTKIFPMTQYYVQNIEAQYVISAGADSRAIVGASGGGLSAVSDFSFSGKEGLFKITSGSVTRLYEPMQDRVIYTSNGNLSMDSIKVKLMTIFPEMDSADYTLSINGNISVNVASGTAVVNQKLKMLPGVELNVASGAELTVSKDGAIILTDKDHWVTNFAYYPAVGEVSSNGITFNNKGTVASVVRYSPTREQVKMKAFAPKHDSAKLCVNGTLEANGNVYSTTDYEYPSGTVVTGTLTDNMLSGTGKFINKASYNSSMVSKEYWGNNTSNIAYIHLAPVFGNIVGKTFPSSFTDTSGIVYRGYHHDINKDGVSQATDYIWSDTELTGTVTVILMDKGEEVSSWTDTVYPGMDYSSYFSDKACSVEAKEGDDPLYCLMPSGEACIINNSGVQVFDTLKNAVAAAKVGDTVRLLEDVVYTGRGGGLIINSDKNFMLDLNNHSITSDEFVILNRGTLSIYGGDVLDENGNELPAGKLITTGTVVNASCIFNQIGDSGESYVGEMPYVGGNLELIAYGNKKAALFNYGGHIGQFGDDGSKIKITSESLSVENTGTIDAFGGAGSYVETVQTSGAENKWTTAFKNTGTITVIGDTDSTVKITQNYNCTLGNNPWLLTNEGTIVQIGGTGATVLLSQTASSGYGFGLRADGGVIKKIGGPDVKRVEIISAHIPLYLDSDGEITEIAENTLFVAKTRFASQSAIWNIGEIKDITGGWFNSSVNTIASIFETGVNASTGSASTKKATNSIVEGYFISTSANTTIKSEVTGQEYPCFSIVSAEAKIGDTYYNSVNTAVNAALPGETVVLLKDVTVTGSAIYAQPDVKDVTLNLNNHSITAGSYALLNRGTMNIYGGDFEDAEGIPLPPGRLITTGTSPTLSSCIYNQAKEWVTNKYVYYDAHIYSISGNLELVDEKGVAYGAIYNYGAHIGTIGTDGSKIQIRGSGRLLNMTDGATLDVLGGEGSTVEFYQEAGASNYPRVISVVGTGTKIETIGDKNATVKVEQITSSSLKVSNATIFISMIYLNGGGTVSNLGTAEGSKVLMNQTRLTGNSGWAIEGRGGSIGKIGSDKSKVEIIGNDYAVYHDSTFGEITGNTMVYTKQTGNAGDGASFRGVFTNITGGYFGQFNPNNRLVEDRHLQKLEDTGYELSENTVTLYSEALEQDLEFRYVVQKHDHISTNEPEINWITEDGIVKLRAEAPCTFAGCHEQVIVDAEAEVIEDNNLEDGTYDLTYRATVTFNESEYTREKSESLAYKGEKTMKYDDRLTGADIRVFKKGEPNENSYKVGTTVRDDAVIKAVGNKLVAAGIGGGAVAYIDDGVYEITVEKAVIDMIMITGHSMGMGSKGNTPQSVVVEDGQAYSFTGTNVTSTGGYNYAAKIGEYEGVGLGYTADKRPPEVDFFTEDGPGVIGEDSGLAWKWNKLTGNKVYVVNNAVGSTSMYHWYIDQANDTATIPILTNAKDNFTAARKIIQNEVDAGHFDMGQMIYLNHSAANYSTTWGAVQKLYNDKEGEVWFKYVFDEMRTTLNKDWDGDGTIESGETTVFGFIPIWSEFGGVGFGTDKPATQFMGASDAYPDMFTASLTGRMWSSEAGLTEFFENYSAPFTKFQNGSAVTYPQVRAEVFADDVHYTQVMYNVIGDIIATNVYQHLFTPVADENVSVKLLKTDGVTEVAPAEDDNTAVLDMKFGDRLTLVPEADPVTVDDLTFTATGSMGIEYPLTIYPKSGGEGSLIVSLGDRVLKTIEIDMGDAEPVAQVGETIYYDLQEAINKAPAEGVVELLRDVELGSGVTVEEGQNVTLNLNNFTITNAGTVITNNGTLSINGGVLDAEKAGTLINTTSGAALINKGTMGTVGGKLLIKAAKGYGINVSGGTIDTIGGTNSDVTVEAIGNPLYVAAAGTINNIGASTDGVGGKVTLIQDNTGATSATDYTKYTARIMGTINRIGGKNAEVTIQQTNNLAAHSATIFMTGASAKIMKIGGDGATVNIIQDNRVGTSSGFQIGIWMNGGYIDKLGSGGTVNIRSNKLGVYFGGSDASDTYINTIGEAGTVNITGLITDGVEGVCSEGIQLNTNKHENDIGVLGAGGIVNINAKTYGINVSKYNSDIGSIATAGTVNITSKGIGIYFGAAGADIDTIGAGGTVNITTDGDGIKLNAAATINSIGGGVVAEDKSVSASGTVNIFSKVIAINVGGGGQIDAIGGVDANVTIDNTAGKDNNAIYISNGAIGTIGSTGTGKVVIEAHSRGILISSSDGDTTDIDLKAITGNVEITSPSACIYVNSGNTLDTVGGVGSRIVLNQNCALTEDGTAMDNVKYPNITKPIAYGDANAVDAAVIVAGGTLNNFGDGTDCLVEVNSRSRSIYVSGKLDVLGNNGSTVVLTQKPVQILKFDPNKVVKLLPYVIHIYGGTINHIGGTNGTVKLIQESKAEDDNGNGSLIYINGTLNNIGTMSGSKVLMDQTMLLSGDCGWGLNIRGGTVGTIGSDNSVVEIIADHCPVYTAKTTLNITGNTLMVGKRDYSSINSASYAFWTDGASALINSITGGYFAQGGVTVDENYANHIFNAANQTRIANAGYALSKKTVERTSEITGEKYNCLYVHQHAFTEEVATAEFLKSAATCNAKALYFKSCECGEKGTETFEYGEFNLDSHKAGEATQENVIAATCKAEGSYDEVIRCTVCGEVLSSEKKTTSMLAHTEVDVPATPPTCTTTGLTAGKKCSVCGEFTEKQVVIPAQHTCGDPVSENVKEATCTAEGSYDQVYYCTVCKEVDHRVPVTLPMIDHSYGAPVFNWTTLNGTEAVCEVTFTCGSCSKTYKPVVEITFECEEPTETADGYIAYTATAQDEYGKEYSDTENVILPMTGAALEIVINDVPKASTNGITVTAAAADGVLTVDTMKGAAAVTETYVHLVKATLADGTVQTLKRADGKAIDGEYALPENTVRVEITSAMLGDPDTDGAISATDAAIVLRVVAELEVLDELKSLAANVDFDSAISATDAAKVLRVVAELDPTF